MYEITITDDTTTWTMPALEIPLTISDARKSTDVEVLSNDVYTDVFPYKRTGTHEWAFMTKANYDILYGFYYRQQFTLFKYPRITITGQGITNMISKIEVGARNIIDHCGEAEDVQFRFRESKQNP